VEKGFEYGCDWPEEGVNDTCDAAFLESQRVRNRSVREPGGEVEHEEEETRQGECRDLLPLPRWVIASATRVQSSWNSSHVTEIALRT
jgi:hypothetical protein